MPATPEISSASEKAPVSCGGGEAELALHRQQEDREGVVEDAPGDGLGDRQRADDRPRPREGRVAKAGALLERVRRCAHAAAATSSCGEPAPQHADAGGGLGGAGREAAAAHAGLGEDELDLAGGLPVAVEGGDDGADLLVAGAQQEGRRAAVALHADDVDALVGVGELVDAVRRHRAAGVQVGVDQRSERARRLDAVVEVEPQLGQQREVGAEAGGGDHLVGDQRARAVADLEPAAALGDARGCGSR